MTEAEPSKITFPLETPPQICPYCHNDFSELSLAGFENHRYNCWFDQGPGSVKQ